MKNHVYGTLEQFSLSKHFWPHLNMPSNVSDSLSPQLAIQNGKGNASSVSNELAQHGMTERTSGTATAAFENQSRDLGTV